ncbi:hypothetical protein RAS1_03140 [Phycisphaerae bacterium RAS1]|nr:hypothetical protein RAS1_03140 [Phycisphaerae bacterium RAS1]
MKLSLRVQFGALVATFLVCSARPALATADFVEHVATTQVFGEPAGVTMREPDVPREDEPVELWVRIGYSFFYTDVAIYYTLDGSDPTGAFGVAGPGTTVLRSSTGAIQFVRNEPNNIDWWRAFLSPSLRTYGTHLRYKIGAWHSGGGTEVFANNYGCSDGTCDNPAAPPTIFDFRVKLAWPGKGAPAVDHQLGYPPVYFWKEEAVIGNNFINVQLDQNGAVYDVYYPSAGCVQGVGTKNEGYVDGLDTFPPGLPLGNRGQMHVNQLMPGIRIDDVTYWLSNESAAGYSDISQQYSQQTNTVVTTQRLTAGGNNILVQQYDFAPKGVTYPNDDGGMPNRGLYVKRMVLTNLGPSTEVVNVYYYGDFAINGGDNFDTMFVDQPRGAMVAYDNTLRNTSSSGEYNPTTFSGYDKDVSVYLSVAMKTLSGAGGGGGTAATDSWRDTSTDNGQGWIGAQVTLPPNSPREVDFIIVGGFDDFPAAAGTYAFQMDGPIDWFLSQNMATLQQATDAYWQNWLSSGVTVDLPDPAWEELFERGLLSTALHLDGVNGGLIAGYHNGAYPFVWPRDAVYGGVTLARTGHTDEVRELLRFLRDVTFRGNEPWGRGFWYQKYTTDGYIVWSAPQVDETAVSPWGLRWYIDVTNDTPFLGEIGLGGFSTYRLLVADAARAMSEDSTIDSRCYYDDTFALMHGNNIWEDQFDLFIYTNANVVRGLRDAANLATQVGLPADAALFDSRANAIQGGVEARLDWNGENSDISQLGIVYPFQVISPTSSRASLLVNRFNGTATDNLGRNKPLVNTSGEFAGLIDRYWGDSYWDGTPPYQTLGQPTANPWFLTTAWYGLFFAERADYTANKTDIDVHKAKMDLCIANLGPAGLGAEQIAPKFGPGGSLLYPGQNDFVLQAAWPNAWESESTFVDGVMALVDYRPDARNNAATIAPKLPTGWSSMTFNNLRVGPHRFNVTAAESSVSSTQAIANTTGMSFSLNTTIRVPAGSTLDAVTQNGTPVSYSYNAAIGAVSLTTSINAPSVFLRVFFGTLGDMNCDGNVDILDINPFILALADPAAYQAAYPACKLENGDINGDGQVNVLDINAFVALLSGG